MPVRLFLGLFPDDREAEATARLQDAVAWPDGVRRVRRENLHVTLHFLGDVDEPRVAGLADALAVAAAPVAFVLDRFTVWHAGIAVLEPTVAPRALTDLHARLGEALDAAGRATEARAYRPHATLARHAQGATLAEGPPPLRWAVARYTLVHSTGGRYVPLRHYPLATP